MNSLDWRGSQGWDTIFIELILDLLLLLLLFSLFYLELKISPIVFLFLSHKILGISNTLGLLGMHSWRLRSLLRLIVRLKSLISILRIRIDITLGLRRNLILLRREKLRHLHILLVLGLVFKDFLTLILLLLSNFHLSLLMRLLSTSSSSFSLINFWWLTFLLLSDSHLLLQIYSILLLLFHFHPLSVIFTLMLKELLIFTRLWRFLSGHHGLTDLSHNHLLLVRLLLRLFTSFV